MARVEYAELLDIMGKIRDQIMKDIPDEEKRRMIFECLVKSDILDLIKKGDKDSVSKQINQCISLAIKEE
jgi:precorrin-2 dehydrogenase/sirohydrochlorin ferrochelatase